MKHLSGFCIDYPPPRLLNFWIGFVIAALVAVSTPVWAQDVTAPGLVGQPACLGGYVHNVDGNHLGLNANVPNGDGMLGVFTNNFEMITYTFLRGRLGGDSSIMEFPLKLRLINGRTGAQVSETDLGTVRV